MIAKQGVSCPVAHVDPSGAGPAENTGVGQVGAGAAQRPFNLVHGAFIFENESVTVELLDGV